MGSNGNPKVPKSRIQVENILKYNKIRKSSTKLISYNYINRLSNHFVLFGGKLVLYCHILVSIT